VPIEGLTLRRNFAVSDHERTKVNDLMRDYGKLVERLVALLAELQKKLDDAITLKQLAALTLDIHDTAQAASILQNRIASFKKEKKQAA
jgi:hypothetical protein